MYINRIHKDCGCVIRQNILLYSSSLLGLLTVLLLSPSHVGPGLSIRVICAEEPYICKDFAETNNILKIITDFSASVKKVRAL